MLCSAVQRPSAIENNLKSVNAWLPRPVRRQALERGQMFAQRTEQFTTEMSCQAQWESRISYPWLINESISLQTDNL